MNLIHSPSRIDIIIHNADAEWWQIIAALGPLVVILGAILFAVISWFTLRRRTVLVAAFDSETKTGSQASWLPRARWALEASLDDDQARCEVGLAALELLDASSSPARRRHSLKVDSKENSGKAWRVQKLPTQRKA